MTNPTRPARQASATCTDAGARRWWRVSFVLLSACYMGCIMPIRSNPDSPPSSSPPKRTRADAPSAAAATSDGVTVERLTVNGHTIEAPELWRGLDEELSAQSRALTPEAYAVHVQQQAAQLITDRIAETLLHQHAVLHLPPEVRDNVDKYVDAEIRKIVSADYDGIQSRYEKALQSRGQTFAEVRQKLRRDITIAGFLEREIRPKVAEPTRAELLAAFEALADSFRKPARRRMSLIDVRIRRHPPAGMDGPSPDQGQTPEDEARSRARFQPVARRGAAAVNTHLARPQQLLQIDVADIGKVNAKPAVEPNAGLAPFYLDRFDPLAHVSMARTNDSPMKRAPIEAAKEPSA